MNIETMALLGFVLLFLWGIGMILMPPKKGSDVMMALGMYVFGFILLIPAFVRLLELIKS